MRLKVFKGENWRIHLFNPQISEKVTWARSECGRITAWKKIDPMGLGDIDKRINHMGGRLLVRLQDYDEKKHGEYLCAGCIGNAVKHGLATVILG